MKLQITIAGQQGSGKTILGGAIIRLLERCGIAAETTVEGRTPIRDGGVYYEQIETEIDYEHHVRLLSIKDPADQIKDLDRRARAANSRADKLQKENTILRDRLGIAPHHLVLPRNVYYSAHDGRFREFKTHRDMGDAFLAEYGERWTLFPINPNAATMFDLVEALTHAQKDS